MIDLTRAVPVRDAIAALPISPSRQTIHRWLTTGIGGVRLEHARIGRAIVTTPEAVARFVEQMSETQVVMGAQA